MGSYFYMSFIYIYIYIAGRRKINREKVGYPRIDRWLFDKIVNAVLRFTKRGSGRGDARPSKKKRKYRSKIYHKESDRDRDWERREMRWWEMVRESIARDEKRQEQKAGSCVYICSTWAMKTYVYPGSLSNNCNKELSSAALPLLSRSDEERDGLTGKPKHRHRTDCE